MLIAFRGTLSGYSAHADQRNIVDFVKRMRHLQNEIYLVHGDDQAKIVLKEQLRMLSSTIQVLIP